MGRACGCPRGLSGSPGTWRVLPGKASPFRSAGPALPLPGWPADPHCSPQADPGFPWATVKFTGWTLEPAPQSSGLTLHLSLCYSGEAP